MDANYRKARALELEVSSVMLLIYGYLTFRLMFKFEQSLEGTVLRIIMAFGVIMVLKVGASMIFLIEVEN